MLFQNFYDVLWFVALSTFRCVRQNQPPSYKISTSTITLNDTDSKYISADSNSTENQNPCHSRFAICKTHLGCSNAKNHRTWSCHIKHPQPTARRKGSHFLLGRCASKMFRSSVRQNQPPSYKISYSTETRTEWQQEYFSFQCHKTCFDARSTRNLRPHSLLLGHSNSRIWTGSGSTRMVRVHVPIRQPPCGFMHSPAYTRASDITSRPSTSWAMRCRSLRCVQRDWRVARPSWQKQAQRLAGISITMRLSPKGSWVMTSSCRSAALPSGLSGAGSRPLGISGVRTRTGRDQYRVGCSLRADIISTVDLASRVSPPPDVSSPRSVSKGGVKARSPLG